MWDRSVAALERVLPANVVLVANLAAEGVHLAMGTPCRESLQVTKETWHQDALEIGLIRSFPRTDHATPAILRINSPLTRPRFNELTEVPFFRRPRMGSGALAAFFCGLPLTMAGLPLVLGVQAFYALHENFFWERSRYDEALLRALRGQISNEAESAVRRAAEHDWAQAKKVPHHGISKMTLTEAGNILDDTTLIYSNRPLHSQLVMYKTPTEPVTELCYLTWRDADDDPIAIGYSDPTDTERNHVRVWGTDFYGEEALALMKRFRVVMVR